MEFVSNGSVRFKEIHVCLFWFVPNNGFVGVGKTGIGATLCLVVLCGEIVESFFLVIEEEEDSTHFGWNSSIFRVGVKLDLISEGLGKFRIIASHS